MSNNKDFAKELMKQDGIEPQRISEEERKKIHDKIAKDKRQLRQLKYVTLILWIFISISLFCLGLIEFSERGHRHDCELPSIIKPAGILIIWVLIIYAVFCSIRLYIKSRAVTLHEIQATLANIEEQLQRLSEKK